jgi:hypothetical protein
MSNNQNNGGGQYAAPDGQQQFVIDGQLVSESQLALYYQ